MLIGGLQKMTLIDYPGQVSATIFTVGCNFRCHFCHNPELVLVKPEVQNSLLHEDEILNFLASRKNLLDALCITGGEPTMQKDLVEFIQKVKEMGYKVKLDSNGTNPQMLKELIDKKLIDYIAMDVKAPWSKYKKIINADIDLEKIKKSVKIIIDSGLPYEFRSTVIPRLHSIEDIIQMAEQIKGARAYFIQKFKPAKNLVNQDFCQEKSFTSKDLEKIKEKIKDWFEECDVR